MKLRSRSSLVLSLAVAVAACATSPTGRKQLVLLPDSQLNSLGAQAFQEMKGQTPTESDPGLNRYVQCITQPLLAAAKTSVPAKDWEIVVFRSDEANAFALPGGKVGVYTGLLKVAKTDGQLAAVIGHEIGHVQARHGNERMSQGVVAQFGQAALAGGLGDSKLRGPVLAAFGLGAQVGVLLPYGRAQESESDLIGLRLMARAGFDPRESVKLWENMRAASGGKGPPQFLSTHPSGDTRIRDLQVHMAEAMRAYEATSARPSCRRP
jgi:predicted Zn-dependent protease